MPRPRVAGLAAAWAAAGQNANFMRDLLETRLQIELWCNYELFFVCATRLGNLPLGTIRKHIKQPRENQPVLPALPSPSIKHSFWLPVTELNCFSLIYNIINEERQALETVKQPQQPYSCNDHMLAHSCLSQLIWYKINWHSDFSFNIPAVSCKTTIRATL